MARCRRVYAHAHDYHINSISNNRCIFYLISVFLFNVAFAYVVYGGSVTCFPSTGKKNSSFDLTSFLDMISIVLLLAGCYI